MYRNEIAPRLRERFGYKNPMQVPALVKIVLNMGVGGAREDRRQLSAAMKDLALIAGQRPVATLARRSIASFKLRVGMAIGCKATLRRRRMYEFLDRLVNIALPRIRDFHGLSPGGFDGRGNYNLGIREHIVFPEIDYDKTDRIRGFDIGIVTSASNDEEGQALLSAFLMPFAV